MIRVTLLLGAAIYVTLLIAGQDRGQMRPGLADALDKGLDIREITLGPDASDYERTARATPSSHEEAPQLPFTQEPVAQVQLQQPPEPPLPQENPVFTLASLPNLGGDRVVQPDVLFSEEEMPLAEVLYVSASSVNVRMGPSIETNVIARLGQNEAVTLISDADPDWAEVLIEGDGLQGYIAKSLLRATP